MKKPAVAFPFEEPVLFVSFAPNKFEIDKKEKSIFKGSLKMYFALASQNCLAIYHTCSVTPFFLVKNFHYACLTDLKWNSQGLLAIGSLDGYISFADLTEKFSKEKKHVEIEEEKSLELN